MDNKPKYFYRFHTVHWWLTSFFVAIYALGMLPLNAQERYSYNPDAESLFTQALSQYNEGAYENAAEMFETGININPVHQRTTACYIMAAKSWLQISEQTQTIFLLNNLLRRFPWSEYSRGAHYDLGTTYYLLDDYKASVKEFINAIDFDKNDKLSRQAISLVDSIIAFNLSQVEIQELEKETGSSVIKEILARNEKAFHGQPANNEQPKPPIRKRAKSETIRIGILLPLQYKLSPNPAKSAAEDILVGIQYAQEKFSQLENDINIQLVVKDSGRDSVLAKQYSKEFGNDRDLLAVIGPLFSNTTLSCAPIVNEQKLPLITPTANATGIAATGAYVFQANADIKMHARALAQYAIKQLGMTTLAVLSPNNPAIQVITTDFISEAKRLGAIITANEVYEKSSDDLSKHFIALRRSSVNAEPLISFEKSIDKQKRKRILLAGVNEEFLDSLIHAKAKIPVSKLFGKNGLRTAERLKLAIHTPKSSALDKNVPVTAIQGIFVPVSSPEDIGVIASQMTYYNIRTQLLGNAEWYDEAHLETQRRYLNGVMFCSDYFLDEEDSTIISLQQELKRKASKYTLFGLDAMNLVLSCIEEGSTTREQVRECLGNIQFWQGLHSTVTLKGGRVNRVMQILQFLDGEVRCVAEITVE